MSAELGSNTNTRFLYSQQWPTNPPAMKLPLSTPTNSSAFNPIPMAPSPVSGPSPPCPLLPPPFPLSLQGPPSQRRLPHLPPPLSPPPIPPSPPKLPVLIYYSGGGFVFYHPSSSIFHDSCPALAARLPALVISVDYRLAPEHRLPADCEEAVEAIEWVRNQARDPNGSDHWLKDHADFSNCFLMGRSAGGNIAYFASLRANDLDLSPLKIRGLILNSAYFGGVQRTASELRLVNDRVLQQPANDLIWALNLPLGADWDHEYCNPREGDGIYGEKIGRPPRCFLNGYGGDPLVDQQKVLVKILEGRGVEVSTHFPNDGFHGVEIFEPAKEQALCDNTQKFMYASHATSTL